MHNLCVFCTFSTFTQKNVKGFLSFSKVMCIKSPKMMFGARIIRHKLCMIYAFSYFFCSKIIFDQKFFSLCWDKLDYPGSIVYLSCCTCIFLHKPQFSFPCDVRNDIFLRMMICNRFIYLTYISFFSHIAGVPQVSKYLTCQSNPKRAASLHVQWWISSSDCQLTFPIALWLKVVALQCISYYVTSQPSPKRAPGLHVQWRSSLHGYQLALPIVSWLKVVVLQEKH